MKPVRATRPYAFGLSRRSPRGHRIRLTPPAPAVLETGPDTGGLKGAFVVNHLSSAPKPFSPERTMRVRGPPRVFIRDFERSPPLAPVTV